MHSVLSQELTNIDNTSRLVCLCILNGKIIYALLFILCVLLKYNFLILRWQEKRNITWSDSHFLSHNVRVCVMDHLAESPGLLLLPLRSLHTDGDGVGGLCEGRHHGYQVTSHQDLVSVRLPVFPGLSRRLHSLAVQAHLVHLPVRHEDVAEGDAEKDESSDDSTSDQNLMKISIDDNQSTRPLILAISESSSDRFPPVLWVRHLRDRGDPPAESCWPPPPPPHHSPLLPPCWWWAPSVCGWGSLSEVLNTTIRYLGDTTDRVIWPYLTSPYLPQTRSIQLNLNYLRPLVKAHMVLFKFADPDSSVTRLYSEGEAALELGVVPVEVHVVHVAAGLDVPGRVREPLPLTEGVQVDPPEGEGEERRERGLTCTTPSSCPPCTPGSSSPPPSGSTDWSSRRWGRSPARRNTRNRRREWCRERRLKNAGLCNLIYRRIWDSKEPLFLLYARTQCKKFECQQKDKNNKYKLQVQCIGLMEDHYWNWDPGQSLSSWSRLPKRGERSLNLFWLGEGREVSSVSLVRALNSKS